MDCSHVWLPAVVIDPLGLDPCPSNPGPDDPGCVDVTAPPPDAAQLLVFSYSCVNGIGWECHWTPEWFQTNLGFTPGGGAGGAGVGGNTPTASAPGKQSNNPCNKIAGKGGVIPVNSPNGELRFEFGPQGNLVGFGVQLNGGNPYTASNISVPPWTYFGVRLSAANSVTVGFNNPVNIGSGFQQVYFQSATFSSGSFTAVNGAVAPLGVPWGSPSGSSAPLRWALNGKLPFTSGLGSLAQKVGNTLNSLATTVSQNVSCSDIFGGD